MDDTIKENSAFFNENDDLNVTVLHRCHMIEKYSVPLLV